MQPPVQPTILVVEDEVLVRLALVDMLQDAGFETFEAGTAAEAIDVLEAVPRIRVVFTDIEMPGGMDGLALSHYIRDRWPPTLIVISSGRQNPRPDQMPDQVDFLSKPYGQGALEGVMAGIRKVLASQSDNHGSPN